MITSNGGGVLRRRFIAIATHAYDACGYYGQLPGVVDEVKTMRDWLCDPGLGDGLFTDDEPALADNPSKAQIEAVWDSGPCWSSPAGLAVVVFVTGHGIVRDGGHRLILKTTDPEALGRTSMSTSELIGMISDIRAEHVLLLLDLCYAGATAEQAARMDVPFPREWIVLASTGKDATAQVGALTSAIAGFLDEVRSDAGERFDHGPYLKVADFLEQVQTHLDARGQMLTLVQPGLPALGAFSPCLPNPRHHPHTPTVGAARRDLAMLPADRDAHWAPRSWGVATIDEPRWWFTGRETLMRTLIATATGPPGNLVVTGGAGCGKSAALARLVTLADPLFVTSYQQQVDAIDPALRPPVGAVDVAVLATGKLPHEVLGQICHALAVAVPKATGTPTLEELRTAWTGWLDRRASPVTIVVDAVDEASNPRSLIDDVLTQLQPGHQPKVRLIVGVRSTTSPNDHDAGALADHTTTALTAQRIRVDQPPLWNPHDLIDYAATILVNTPASPYTGQPGQARRAAQTIAGRAGTSFLFTRIAASLLSHGDHLVDPDDAQWLAALDDGLVGLFRRDLHTTLDSPGDRLRAIHLLRAVAYARGRGIPWHHIWPRIADAVADGAIRYGDSDIAWLLGTRLAGYLTTDIEDDTTVYRLYHDSLRTALRRQWTDILQEPQ